MQGGGLVYLIFFTLITIHTISTQVRTCPVLSGIVRNCRDKDGIMSGSGFCGSGGGDEYKMLMLQVL